MSVTEPVIRDIRHAEARVDLRLVVPESLLYLHGHFPGFAILPGVVQLDWAIRYGRRYLAVGDAAAKTVQIKFRKPIRPNRQLSLSLAYVAERRRLSFECRDDADVCSSGQIVFDEP
jgi:3-hydroxymyristoyl/3-hydroxydecanoyl-(acyl carrier protein) dehydratase